MEQKEPLRAPSIGDRFSAGTKEGDVLSNTEHIVN